MPGQPHAIVVIGVAGSGKSTVARALADHEAAIFLDADDFHTVEAKAQMAAGEALTDAQRDPWVAILVRELRRHAEEGRSCVLAFSGLRAVHRQRLRESGVPIRFVYLHGTPLVIAERLAGRSDHFMPLHLLASQLEALEPPTSEPDVVVVDIGGSQAQVLRQVIGALEAAA
jgi:gluconokinase